jgi:hypothetical protein
MGGARFRESRFVRALFVSLAAICAALPGAAQASGEPIIIFQHINDVVAAGSVKLSNGVEVQRADWPALIMAQIPNPKTDKPRTCTATLVGPNVILTAAHCVDSQSGEPRRAELWVASRRLVMRCDMHPLYLKKQYRWPAARASEDYALCVLDDRGSQPTVFKDVFFEVIDTSRAPSPGEKVLMTGFGCDKLQLAANGVLDWVPRTDSLRVGDEQLDAGIGRWDASPAYITTRSNKGKEPALCPGDSGGPLFSGVNARSPRGARRIRGVNSMVCTQLRGDSERCTTRLGLGEWDIISSIAATGTPAFQSWANEWIERNASYKPLVCGVNVKAGQGQCRD